MLKACCNFSFSLVFAILFPELYDKCFSFFLAYMASFFAFLLCFIGDTSEIVTDVYRSV